ncbi:toxin [Streptomyces sp. NPDC047070]|uniref:toxin n=1 Tax=Streptomyces sp. NPDC047070 TaxID=3154923 RepID=UPI00345158B7
MRRLADTLIDPIQVQFPADPDVLFNALVDSVTRWRGHEVKVLREEFPPHTATGLWLEVNGGASDVVIVEERAAVWHQLVILSHEVWHMYRGDAVVPHHVAGPGRQPSAARTDFSLEAEQEADAFGMLVGLRLKAWLDASVHSVYATATHGPGDDLATRIGAALNYRGRQ